MTSKLKIDLSQGVLEVEGSETLVKLIYNDFKHHFASDAELSDLPIKPRNSRSRKRKVDEDEVLTPQAVQNGTETSEVKISKNKPSRFTPTYTILEELELRSTKNRPALVEFMDAKVPITNDERNVVFTYYLLNLLKLETIRFDHIYTCYREANIRVPVNIENSLKLTAKQTGWLSLDETGNIVLTAQGLDYVEKTLPVRP